MDSRILDSSKEVKKKADGIHSMKLVLIISRYLSGNCTTLRNEEPFGGASFSSCYQKPKQFSDNFFVTFQSFTPQVI